MGVRERIMTICLLERLQANPACAKALGIEICAARRAGETDKKEEKERE